METALLWTIKKIFLPWLVKKVLNQAWYQLKKNHAFQGLVIILYLHWQFKTTLFKGISKNK
ncbi:hypothetical protein Cylst_3703 [Cylindrospermum stagnale PCC 7417]|uniref:Uncharacterized protein n=1 Tax=Cylindrospermum stagnale PCC 7417 TaxID=56107 RepID=K9X1B3_9NOST|nr:hypothetical protein Cylst_3703 [Cylindrospermum stagnale PCC 7417]